MKHLLSILFYLLSFLTFAQKPDVVPIIDPEVKPKFKKETNIIIKGGVTSNFINKVLYKNLNDGYKSEIYKAEGASLYYNPYFSIGLENLLSKKFGFHFNLGFFQTQQKYKHINNTQVTSNQTAPSSGNTYYVSATKYLNNNVFLDFTPIYKIKNTRFLAGINVSRTSPTITTKVTITNLNTGETEVVTIMDRPEESYHVYSMLGIMHSFPVKTIEMTVSASYFGFLQKYDSGFNLMIGVLF